MTMSLLFARDNSSCTSPLPGLMPFGPQGLYEIAAPMYYLQKTFPKQVTSNILIESFQPIVS